MPFRTLADVQAWVDEKNRSGLDGMEELRLAIAEKRFAGAREMLAIQFRNDWLQGNAASAMADEQGLQTRAVVAAESQADSAKQALDRSNWAIGISIAAFLLGAVDLLTKHS